MASKDPPQLILKLTAKSRTIVVFCFWPLLAILFLSVLWPRRDLIKEWQEKTRLEKEVTAWEEVLEKYPGYRDVYLKLAILNWQLNRPQEAKERLVKAKELDPYFEKTKELEKILAN